MSDINRYTPTIPPSGIIETVTGNFLLFIASSAPISIRIENGGHAEQLNFVAGGILVRRVKPWENLRFLGAPGTTLEYYQGSSFTDKDETDVRLQIATIAGVATFTEAPATIVSNLPPVSGAENTTGALFAANGGRKRIRVFTHPDNPSWIYARNGTEVNAILQPGSVYSFDGLYSMNYIMGAVVGTYFVYLLEEA